MRLTMLKISLPVLVMMLFQFDPAAGMISWEQAAKISVLAETSVEAAVDELINCSSGEYKDDIYAILDKYLPDAYKKGAETKTEFKDKIFKSLFRLDEKDITVENIINTYASLLVSNFFDKYWKVNADISNAIQSWKDEIKNWDPLTEPERRSIFGRVIVADKGIQFVGSSLGTVDEYFNRIDAIGDSEERARQSDGNLQMGYLQRTIDDRLADPTPALKQSLIVLLRRDVDGDGENVYAEIVDAVLNNLPTVPTVEILMDTICEEFGKHFADFIGSSNSAPAGLDWLDWIDGVDAAVDDPSKREDAVKDFFKPLSEGDTTDLIEKLILIKRNTK